MKDSSSGIAGSMATNTVFVLRLWYATFFSGNFDIMTPDNQDSRARFIESLVYKFVIENINKRP